jgi:hypothetical protein
MRRNLLEEEEEVTLLKEEEEEMEMVGSVPFVKGPITQCYPPNWGRGGGHSYANMVDGEDSENKMNIGSSSKNEDTAGITLTKDQYQNLMSLLEKNNLEGKCSANVVKGSSSFSHNGGNISLAHCGKNSDNGWIVDTGATHHTCYDLIWFTNCIEIEPVSVNLPNGSVIEANYRGPVQLSKDLIIDNVLYLPQFAVNLISVSN